MEILVNESLIGKAVCFLHRSILTEEVVCEQRTVQAYTVRRVDGELQKTVLLNDGSWINAKHLFYPQNEAAARERFARKIQKI